MRESCASIPRRLKDPLPRANKYLAKTKLKIMYAQFKLKESKIVACVVQQMLISLSPGGDKPEGRQSFLARKTTPTPTQCKLLIR